MPSPTSRPELVVGVAGTGTDVGKTWVAAAVARALRGDGVTVAARKPVQSFAAADPPDARDAAVLAAATGERPEDVCPPHRSYALAMAPPMAAAALGRSRLALADLVTELVWPAVEVGLVETVGGVRAPVADDADSAALLRAIDPDLVVLVADAGLGTVNHVRLSAAALDGLPVLVVLNRYDDTLDLHRRNRAWLADRDGFDVVVAVTDVAARVAAGR
ncbi:MAG TPA: AAA family ATPase [Acidimicrobiales bacterium]|nr:AAA family ATPase [Acidimicrobiales bacterium]